MAGHAEALPPIPTGTWDKNHKRYKTCCCHVTTFSLIWGIIAAIFIGIGLLQAMYHSTSDCGKAAVHAKHNRHQQHQYNEDQWEQYNKATTNKPFHDRNVTDDGPWHVWARHVYTTQYVWKVVCRFRLMSVGMYILDAISIGCFLFGLWKKKWFFLIPYLFQHGLALVFNFFFGVVLIVASAFLHTCLMLGVMVVTFGITIFDIYVFVVVLRCSSYLKDYANVADGVSVAPLTLSLPTHVQQHRTVVMIKAGEHTSPPPPPPGYPSGPPPSYVSAPLNALKITEPMPNGGVQPEQIYPPLDGDVEKKPLE